MGTVRDLSSIKSCINSKVRHDPFRKNKLQFRRNGSDTKSGQEFYIKCMLISQKVTINGSFYLSPIWLV